MKMNVYRYTALSTTGERMAGVLTGTDEQAVAPAVLTSMTQLCLSVDPAVSLLMLATLSVWLTTATALRDATLSAAEAGGDERLAHIRTSALQHEGWRHRRASASITWP